MDATTAKFVEEESIVEAGGESIMQNGLMFNRDTNFLYAMTPTKVSEMNSQSFRIATKIC